MHTIHTPLHQLIQGQVLSRVIERTLSQYRGLMWSAERSGQQIGRVQDVTY